MSFTRHVARILASLSLLACHNSATAEQIPIIGTGTLSCGQWAEARSEKDEQQISLNVQWIAGFLGGHNYYRDQKKKTVRVRDLPTISLWMDTYCRNNPTGSIITGAAALVEELGGVKAVDPSRR